MVALRQSFTSSLAALKGGELWGRIAHMESISQFQYLLADRETVPRLARYVHSVLRVFYAEPMYSPAT